MKNCEITIIQRLSNETRETKYHFDDYRVAQAICNILDNVGEPHIEGEIDYFEWLPIKKELRKVDN